MALSLRARFWRFVMRGAFKNQNLKVENSSVRPAQNAAGMHWMVDKRIPVERIDIDGLPAAWIRPVDAEDEKVIIHLHGGGYVTGFIDSHLMMCVPMAKALKRKMLLPEYRLAPANPFPAALEDALKTYRWLLAQGTDACDIVLSGDSAGGGLALATALALRDAGDPLPAALICISPWADLTNRGASHAANAQVESVLRTDVLNKWASFYTDTSNLTNPFVSPVYADFHGLPPLLIQVGSDEILLDDSLTLAQRAQADGVDVSLRVWDELWHAWPVLGDLIPESGMAFEEMREFVIHIEQ
ncbi:MAG: alpha/beta hydrolase [Chloroflexota bacterium]